MYRVLLPIDENEARAVLAAEAVANFPGSDEIEVVVLNVFEEFDLSDIEGGSISSNDIFERVDPPQSMKTVRDILDEHDLTYETRFEHGRISETILSVIDDSEIDHVVIAGRKHTPVGKVLFGSVAQGVILDADVPVTMVGRSR